MENYIGWSERKEKRLNEFKNWFESFAKMYFENSNQKIKYISDAAEIVNDWYWFKLDENVLPVFNEESTKRVDIYTILSGIELSIIAIQPIINNNEKDKINRRFNAELAWFCTFTVLSSWFEFETDKISLIYQDEGLKNFLNEHLTWLTELNPEFEYPFFSNAQTWRVFQMFVSERLKNIA